MFFNGLIIGIISTIIFFYLFKKTKEYPFLVIGGLGYFRVLMVFFLDTPSEYFMPLYIGAGLYLMMLMLRKNQMWMVVLLLIEILFYIYVIGCTTFRLPGMTEFIFAILCILWYYMNKEEVCNDPWGCK